MVPDPDRQHNDSLDPELRRGIERQFDRTAAQSERVAAAVFHLFVRALVIVIVLTGIAFTIDYIALWKNQNALGSVTIRRYYAVGLKNNRTDYESADSEVQTCVNSIFPHRGYYPCWYLRRHNVKEIDI